MCKVYLRSFLLMTLCFFCYTYDDSDFAEKDVYDTTVLSELPNCSKAEHDSECKSLCVQTILCINRKKCYCIRKITKLCTYIFGWEDLCIVDDGYGMAIVGRRAHGPPDVAYAYIGYLPEGATASNITEFVPELTRPALRHHIAHFCPNLDVARECIKKCMKSGKPAFCGKDHVCYCGHKGKTKDKTANAAKVYGQFHDMYAKYFGAQEAGNHGMNT